MCLACIDTNKAEAFADRMVGILNGGALSLMISIGHRTHLFDTLSAEGPGTSREIADRAGLNERYVREWLGAMWGREKAEEMLRTAGFDRLEVHELPHDIQNYWYVARP